MRVKAIACVTGCVFACVLVYTGAQADEIPSKSAVFDIGSPDGADALNVSYLIADNSGLYAYNYPTTTSNSGTITSAGVGFNASSDIVIPASISPVEMTVTSNSVDDLTFFSPGQSGTESPFESTQVSSSVRGNASGTVGPWASASSPNSHLTKASVAEPEFAAPEPATNLLLFVGLLLLPFRNTLVKACGLTPAKQRSK